MPQVGANNEDYAGGSSIFDLPKLAPKAAGERARIWVPDPDSISVQYVHGIGGQEAQQAGGPVPAWGGSWICQGRAEVLKDTTPHSDPETCFMCRMHKDGNPMVGKAKRKFIVQVFRYATDPSGGQPLVPFTMSLLVWQFSDKQYRMLSEIQTQWGPIRDRDLLLTSDQQEFAFKQWAVSALPDLMLARDPSFTTYMQQAWATQSVPPGELERILGRVPSNDNEVLAKIAEVTPQIPGMPAPGMAQPYAAPPMMPAPGMAPAAAPQLPPQPGYAAPPAAAVYPPNGPFDGQPQYGQPPAAPGMVPPAMPPTPPPAQQAAPPLPQAPPAAAPAPTAPPAAPQAPAPAQAQYAPPPAAPVAPQAAPPMAAPPAPQAAPAAPQMPAPAAPGVPQMPAPAAPAGAPPMAPPPVAAPGAVPQPGAPQDPNQPVNYGALLQAPPPPPPA